MNKIEYVKQKNSYHFYYHIFKNGVFLGAIYQVSPDTPFWVQSARLGIAGQFDTMREAKTYITKRMKIRKI